MVLLPSASLTTGCHVNSSAETARRPIPRFPRAASRTTADACPRTIEFADDHPSATVLGTDLRFDCYLSFCTFADTEQPNTADLVSACALFVKPHH